MKYRGKLKQLSNEIKSGNTLTTIFFRIILIPLEHAAVWSAFLLFILTCYTVKHGTSQLPYVDDRHYICDDTSTLHADYLTYM